MFKGNNNNMARTPEANSPDSLNRIVDGTTIEGEIRSDGNIRIDGKVKGTITTQGRLVVGPTGVIEGEVICKNADIEGVIKGKIRVNGLLSLQETSKVTAEVNTDKLKIATGAYISGPLNMDSPNKPSKIEQNANGQAKGERPKVLPA